MAAVTGLLVALQVDSSGLHPSWPEGPGLTLDESFNVHQGVFLWRACGVYGIGLIDPKSWMEIFSDEQYLADHPPLGRAWLGAFHEAGCRLLGRPAGGELDYSLGRMGSAAAFAITLFLIGRLATWCFDRRAGLYAAFLYVMMFRVFGHAHLAALETVTNLAWTGAAMGLCWAFSPWTELPPSRRRAFLAGCLLGAALLTKIQGVLMIPPAVVWMAILWRQRVVVPLLLWTLGVFVVFIAWPYLWLDPVGHTLEYLGRTTNRAVLSVYYMGHVYKDRETPWHYPWVIFAVTQPVLVLLTGLWGSGQIRPLPGEGKPSQATARSLCLALALFPLLLFSLPGIATYDGERLFLISCPTWAVLAGGGAADLMNRFRRRLSTEIHPPRERLIQAGVGLLGLTLSGGLVWTMPQWLSTYSVLVVGLPGASRLGFEVNYWADGVTRSFWNDIAKHVGRDETIEVAPVLHQLQLEDWRSQNPAIRQNRWQLRPYRQEDPPNVGSLSPSKPSHRWVVIFQRKADLPASLLQELAKRKPVAGSLMEGVQLAALYDLAE